MQGISSVTSAPFAPAVPNPIHRKMDAEVITSWEERMSSAVEIDLSWAAEMRTSTMSVVTEKVGHIQNMLDTLSKIEEQTETFTNYAEEKKADNVEAMLEALASVEQRVDSLRSHADMLISQQEDKEGSMFILSLVGRIKTFIAMVRAYRAEQAALEELLAPVDTGLIQNKVTSGMIPVDGLKEYLEEIRSELETQQRGLGRQTNAWQQKIVSGMSANEILNPTLAAEIASLVSGQMLNGLDIFLGIDGVSGGSRLTKMLRDDVERNM